MSLLTEGGKIRKIVRLLTLQGISFHNKFNQIADKIKVLNRGTRPLHWLHQPSEQDLRNERTMLSCGRPKTILARDEVF